MRARSLIDLIDINAYSVPGCQAVVHRDGQLLGEWQYGYADVVKEELLTSEHSFPMGSLLHSLLAAMVISLMRVSTVPITATLQQIAKHYRQDGGRLALIVSSYPRLRSLTLLNLLQHTSGLPSYNQTEVFLSALMRNLNKTWQVEAYLDMITGSDIDYCYGYQPVTKGSYSYSTTNFLIASLVVTAITGRDMLDELEFFAKRYFPGDVVLASTRDTKIIDSIKMVHGYVLPSCPYRALFKSHPLVSYSKSSECRAYDVTKAQTLNDCAGLSGFATLKDLTEWMDFVWLEEALGPAEKTFFPSLVLASELTTGGNPVYSGLGVMQMLTEEFGPLFWMQNFSYGHEIVIVHAQESAITLGLMLNINRELVGLDKGGLVHQLLREVI